MNIIREKYEKEVVPAMQEEFSLKNKLQVPRLEKVVVNVGTGADEKSGIFGLATKTLERITGQKPIPTRAKKSIAGFKIRQGNVVGVQVTLRGKRMFDFFQKLVHVALPRVRDFQGISPKSVDQSGNCTIGFREHMVFPEINLNEVERVHGLEVVLSTSAKDRKKGFSLLKKMGVPFKGVLTNELASQKLSEKS